MYRSQGDDVENKSNFESTLNGFDKLFINGFIHKRKIDEKDSPMRKGLL